MLKTLSKYSFLIACFASCGPSPLDQAMTLLKQVDSSVIEVTAKLQDAPDAEKAAESLIALKTEMEDIGAQLKLLEDKHPELNDEHAKSFLLVQRHQIVINLAELNKAAEAARLRYRREPVFEKAVQQFSQGI